MLNENIRELRKSKGLSQEELALKLNVVRQTVSKWERGLSVPDAEMLVAIGGVLDTPVSTLLVETVPASEPEGLQALSEKLEVLNDQFARAQESKRRTPHAPLYRDRRCHGPCPHRTGDNRELVSRMGFLQSGIRGGRNVAPRARMGLCADRAHRPARHYRRDSRHEKEGIARALSPASFQATARCSTSAPHRGIIAGKRRDQTPPPTPRSKEPRHDPA
ncbi:helix-turn-helix domain-containing protein [Collinsella stercoris]|uniref:helix-turn-helix domain-containing protein n=1 Tax=Collinsella stercoris TaxID=147206 RepID=UPI0039928118